jgi:hypothetical protein
MKDWEAEYLACRTAQHIRAMDKAEQALDFMRRCGSPEAACTSAVRLDKPMTDARTSTSETCCSGHQQHSQRNPADAS